MPCAAARSCSAIDWPWPPTRPGLMLMIRQAPSADRLGGDLRRCAATRPGRSASGSAPAAARGPGRRRSRAAARSSSGRTDRARRDARRRRGDRRRWRRPSAGRRRTASRTVSDRLDVPARLDLDLDAPVAGGELHLDALGELVERILDADRDAGRDPAGDDRSGCRRAPGTAACPAAARTDPTRPSRPPPSPCCGRGCARSAGKISRGCANSRPSTSGAMNSAMMCHAVRVVSEL